MKKPTFSYAPRGNQWAVLKWDYLPNAQIGTTIQYFLKKEDARAYADHLNKMEQVFKLIS